MRPRQINLGSKEDIVEYTYNSGGVVRCLVGHGEVNAVGQFVPTPSQNYEVYELTGAAFDALMQANAKTGKPAGVFRKDDLWEFVDGTRDRILNPHPTIPSIEDVLHQGDIENVEQPA
jgi:hypothetical protein